MAERPDPLKKMVGKPQTMDGLLAWYEDCRTDIENCPKAQKPTLLKILDQRFREEEMRLRLQAEPRRCT